MPCWRGAAAPGPALPAAGAVPATGAVPVCEGASAKRRLKVPDKAALTKACSELACTEGPAGTACGVAPSRGSSPARTAGALLGRESAAVPASLAALPLSRHRSPWLRRPRMGMGSLFSSTTGACPRALELSVDSPRPATPEPFDRDDARVAEECGSADRTAPVDCARGTRTSSLRVKSSLAPLRACRGDVRKKREALGRGLLRSPSLGRLAPLAAAGLVRALPGDTGRELQRSFMAERNPGSVRFCRSLLAISARCSNRSRVPSSEASIATGKGDQKDASITIRTEGSR